MGTHGRALCFKHISQKNPREVDNNCRYCFRKTIALIDIVVVQRPYYQYKEVGVLLDKVDLGSSVVRVYLYSLNYVQTQTMGMMFHVQFAMNLTAILGTKIVVLWENIECCIAAVAQHF
jgi:hypothetical protein